MTGRTPNTLFGVIPLGKVKITQPLKTVASVSSSTEFFLKRLIIGVILLGTGLYLLGSSAFIAIILILFGAISVLGCYTTTFVLTNNAGESNGYEISILEKSKVEEFVDEINTSIADL